jgi:8-oxo-dGTP diphosphatase
MKEKPYGLSVKMVLRDDNGRCLLLKRSMNSKWYAGKWEFPGGKVDPGENFGDALLREVFEETGLRITIQRVAGTAESEMPTVKVVHLIMEGQAEAGKVCLSNEHDDYAWVDPEDILKMDLVEHFKMFAMEYVAR